MHLSGLRQCDPKYGIIITKIRDYYKLNNNFYRELKQDHIGKPVKAAFIIAKMKA